MTVQCRKVPQRRVFECPNIFGLIVEAIGKEHLSDKNNSKVLY